MRKAEQAMIWRVYDALAVIPLPNGYGTSTASINGIVGYVNDMRDARPKVLAALAGIAMGDETATFALDVLALVPDAS